MLDHKHGGFSLNLKDSAMERQDLNLHALPGAAGIGTPYNSVTVRLRAYFPVLASTLASLSKSASE